jgi:hypothetical protein
MEAFVRMQIPPQSLSPKKLNDFLRRLGAAARIPPPQTGPHFRFEYTSSLPDLPSTFVHGAPHHGRDVLLRVHSTSAAASNVRGSIVVFESCRPSLQITVRLLSLAATYASSNAAQRNAFVDRMA